MAEDPPILAASSRPFSPAARNPACLVHVYPPGPRLGARYPLDKGPVVIGRGEMCDIRVADESVARRHACVQSGLTGYRLTDLQSATGTFVNDQKIDLHELKDGDTVRAGIG